MAKGRIRSRMELREQYDAAEARERDDSKDEEGDEEPEASEEGAEEGEEEAAPVVKKKAKKPAKESKPRKKTVKAVRRKVVWVVCDNSSKKVATYDYTKKQEADEHAARLATEKKQTYYVQPVKEPIEE